MFSLASLIRAPSSFGVMSLTVPRTSKFDQRTNCRRTVECTRIAPSSKTYSHSRGTFRGSSASNCLMERAIEPRFLQTNMKNNSILVLLTTFGLAASVGAFYNGELIKVPGTGVPVFVWIDGRKHGLPDPTTLTSMGFRWSDVHTYAATTVNAIPHGPNYPATRYGGLIRNPATGAVYIAWDGKWGIANPGTLYAVRGKVALGYSPWTFVKTFPNARMVDVLPTKTTIRESTWPAAVFYTGECTWWVAQLRKIPRWTNDGRGGNAYEWYPAAAANLYNRTFGGGSLPGWRVSNTPSRPPVPGAIMCFGRGYPGSSGYGHVAFVLDVDYSGSRVKIAHAWQGLGAYRIEWAPMWGWRDHQGYIF